MTARGRLITLEGGEGGGKSTQARLLADTLAASGLAVLRTREPGGSPGSEVLRDLLLGGRIAWSPPAETLLHFAHRAEHVERTIRPALAAGMWVVCDRFYDSTMAYQGYGQFADRAAIATLIGLLGLRPDLTLVLDVPVAVSLERLAARGTAADRYERLGSEFFVRIREGFLAIAAAEPARCAVIDGTPDPATVAASIMANVVGCLLPPPPVGGGRGRGGACTTLGAVSPLPQPLPQGEGGRILAHARAMRRNPTSAEHALWRALRAKTADGLKFRRQAPIGRYIADFYCAETRMVVELDGASHDDAPEDAVRDAWMRGQGITVLRFWNNEVLGNLDGVLRIILSAIPHGTP